MFKVKKKRSEKPHLEHAVLCMSSAVHALLRADGACGIQLHWGESQGRHRNSSAAHSPPTGKHKSPGAVLAGAAAAGAAFCAAAAGRAAPG